MQRTPGALSTTDATARQVAADAATAAANAATAAADAATIGQNARQMVLNDRPTLQSLQSGADAAQAAVTVSDGDRADLRVKLDALSAVVAAIKPVTIASGQAKTVSLLALGTSVDLTVTLSRTMPAIYNAEVIPISSGLVAGNATIVVKSKTATSVTLTITALVAVAASSVVSVIAWG